jgi:hypothetical protein
MHHSDAFSVIKGISKNSKIPSLLVQKTPDSFGEMGSDEAKKTVFRDAIN